MRGEGVEHHAAIRCQMFTNAGEHGFMVGTLEQVLECRASIENKLKLCREVKRPRIGLYPSDRKICCLGLSACKHRRHHIEAGDRYTLASKRDGDTSGATA